MNRNITRKLDHAKGKLRDKASQPDYRDRFQDEGDSFDRGGTGGPLRPRFTSTGKLDLSSVLIPVLKDLKQKASHVFDHKARSIAFKVRDYVFSFEHKAASFAKGNNLALPAAEQLFPEIRHEAEQLLAMTKRRLLKAEPWGRNEPDPETIRPRVEWYLTFRTFLIPVEPQPWHDFYEKLHLDPREVDPEPD